MGSPPAPGTGTNSNRALRLIVLIGLGVMAACPSVREPTEVWLDRAPHLLDVDWRLPKPNERGVTSTTPRSVLEFFASRSESLQLRLHGWARSEPMPVRITLNGGCEAGTWNLSPHPGEGSFTVAASCVRPGVNLLEFESGVSKEGFSLESVSIEPTDAKRVSLAPSDVRLEPARVGLQMRTAVISGTRSFDLPLRVDQPSILETALGLPGRGWTRSSIQVRVRLVIRGTDGAERVVADRTLGAGGEGAAVWEPVRADLSAYAGQAVTLHIERETISSTRAESQALPPFADPANLVTIEAPRLLPLHPRPGGPPPIVLVVFDTLRADHLSMYGYRRETAPHLASLARDGVTFGTCLSAAPWTLPSVATILTGLYPWQHQAGLRLPLTGAVSPEDEADFLAPFRTFRMVSRMSPHATTLAERLSAGGYLSAGFVENSYLSDRSGLAKGFARYVWANELRAEVEDPAKRAQFYSRDQPVRDWLEGHEGSPLFLFRHYIAPHLPYMAIPGDEQFVRPSDAPELGDYFEDEEGLLAGNYGPPAKRRIVDLYDESIRLADRRFGDLLGALRQAGLYDRALIIVTSDHGEEFWDHGGYGHGHSLYKEVIRVPLIVKLPGGRFTGTRALDPVRSIDLAPTILELAGLADASSSATGGASTNPRETPLVSGSRREDSDGGATASAPLHRDSSGGVTLPGRSLSFGAERHGGEREALAGAMLYGPPRKMAWRDGTVLIRTEMRPERLIFVNRPSPSARPVELYDVLSDPAQTRNLASSRPELVVLMNGVLEHEWKSASPGAASPGGLDLPPEELEQLEALGYVGARKGSKKTGERDPAGERSRGTPR